MCMIGQPQTSHLQAIILIAGIVEWFILLTKPGISHNLKIINNEIFANISFCLS